MSLLYSNSINYLSKQSINNINQYKYPDVDDQVIYLIINRKS